MRPTTAHAFGTAQWQTVESTRGHLFLICLSCWTYVVHAQGSCTLGYNENGGARIFVRLRTDDLRDLRPYRQLVNTLIHELCHNAFGPHTEPFWRYCAGNKPSIEPFFPVFIVVVRAVCRVEGLVF